MSEWELSKENIQPLNTGRKTGILRSSLSEKPPDYLEKKRQFYEHQLRVYEGDDPLSIWCEYIRWIEQTCPKGGRDGNIGKLIQQCLCNLKDEEKYQNDNRFIDIWLKFANVSAKPSEVYSNMYSRNIGCLTASFFSAWAYEMEQMGNLKRADEIITDGINRNAQPVDLLKFEKHQLEARLTKVIAASVEAPQETDHRSAFTILKPQENNKAPISRTGCMTLAGNKENLTHGFKQPLPKSVITTSNIPFRIFNADGGASANTSAQTEPGSAFVLNKENTKENEKLPGKWTKVKVPQNAGSIRTKEAQFVMHCDSTPQPSSACKAIPHGDRVLSSRKYIKPPVALFEPRDPMKRPMYNEMNVYGGVEEYSFEEIHAAIWQEKRKKVEKERKRQEEEREKELMKEKIRLLEEQLQHLACFQKSLIKGNMVNHNNLETEKNNQESIKPQSFVFNESSSTIPKDNDIQANSLASGSNINCKDPQLGSGSWLLASEENSMKEKIDSHNNIKIPKDTSFAASSLGFYHDPTEQVLQNQPPPAVPFAIYHDETSKVSVLPSKLEPEEDDAFDMPENDENAAPPDYVPCIEKRELAGILQPSINIHYVSLEDQQLSSNDDSEDEVLAEPLYSNNDYTLIPPANTEQFTMSPHFASTPCARPVQIPMRPANEDKQVMPPPTVANSDVLDTLEEVLNISNCPKVQESVMLAMENVSKIDTGNQFLTMALYNLHSCLGLSDNPKVKHLISNALTRLNSGVERKSISQSTLAQRSGGLSVIMENSREGSTKSSSSSSSCSSSSSLTRMKSLSLHHNTSVNTVVNKSSAVLRSIIDETFQTYCAGIDPFDATFTSHCLRSLTEPITDRCNFYDYKVSCGSIKTGALLSASSIAYTISKLFGEGAYAKVYMASTNNSKLQLTMDETLPNTEVAVKVCKDANAWEFYICSELCDRLKEDNIPNIKESVMYVHSAFNLNNGIALVTDFCSFGSLLNIVNAYKSEGDGVPECIVLYFTLELITIVSQIHKCGIIHADVKPDNFVLNKLPDDDDLSKIGTDTSCLRLIDFGRAIDLTLFKPGITFNTVIETNSFKCIEMKEGQPWVFQPDWFGVLSTIHVMLFSNYMKVRRNRDGEWEPVMKFKRYWQADIWEKLFHTFLNIPSCYNVPDVKPFIQLLKAELGKRKKNFTLHAKRMHNIIFK